MHAEQAIARVVKLAERRREKASAYFEAAALYEERALSADEVMSSMQRDFLVTLGVSAIRSAKSMADDADALEALLGLAGYQPEARHD